MDRSEVIALVVLCIVIASLTFVLVAGVAGWVDLGPCDQQCQEAGTWTAIGVLNAAAASM